jgi:hypothetical protein
MAKRRSVRTTTPPDLVSDTPAPPAPPNKSKHAKLTEYLEKRIYPHPRAHAPGAIATEILSVLDS